MLLEPRSTFRGSQRLRLPLPSQPAGPLPVGRRGRGGPPPVVRDAERAPFVAPIRLRYLIIIGLVGLGLQALVPRAIAYWRLHGVATQLADYGQCMVGPTGPGLLRERPSEFWRLVRRRLVASPPDARPFGACVAVLEQTSDVAARRRSHQAKAREFREYAPLSVAAGPTFSLSDLNVTTARLEALAETASWFLRAPYGELVRPSRNARSAPHPIELPTPARGRGLPASPIGHGRVRATPEGYVLAVGKGANASAYRSEDGGVSWGAVDIDESLLRNSPGQCSVGQSGAAFKLAMSAEQLRIESWLHAELETSFPLASAESRLLAFSCDEEAAVVIVGDPERSSAMYRLCPHRERCKDLPLPSELVESPRPEAVVSAARVRGVAVLSVAYQGIVRVFSSRNDGESWTPAVIAYDRQERQADGRAEATPSRLLALDGRVLLYAGSDRSRASYPALLSDDFGASWHARR